MAKGLDKAFLTKCLDDGMSLPEIGKLTGRAPGTVGYWVKRHGLVANGSRKFRPGKGIPRAALEPLVEQGITLGRIAKELEAGIQTVSYWIEKYGLPAPIEVRRQRRSELLRAGETRGTWRCRHHGEAEFFADASGAWRCRLCRQEAVSRRRRKVKRILVDEAGGECAICGYDRAIGALHFHHLEPETKRFAVTSSGHTIGLARAREEAAKCVLLCANCHVEVETGITPLPAITTDT